MRIIADRNIPFVAEAFASLGEVHALPAAEITAERVANADILLVRSTIKVNRALLEHSRVRFVATATIGIDHLDTAWLNAAGIAWTAAPGSNADSVLLWWVAAVLHLGRRDGWLLERRRVGIVGVGAVGGRIERFCRALGMHPFVCDPPRARAENGGAFIPIEDLLQKADLITFHVPLERQGADATQHLLNEKNIALLAPGAVLVNASRGEVIESASLIDFADKQRGALLLDVFENEPAVSPHVVSRAAIATPHIAGHSVDGKVNGTLQIYAAACRHFDRAPSYTPPPLSPRPEAITINPHQRTNDDVLREVIEPFYRVADDDAALRSIMTLAETARGPAFRAYRENYPAHRELRGVKICARKPRRQLLQALDVLGANVKVI